MSLETTDISMQDALIFLQDFLVRHPEVRLPSIPLTGPKPVLEKLQKCWKENFFFSEIIPNKLESLSTLGGLFMIPDLSSVLLSFLDGRLLLPLRCVCRRWNELIPKLAASWSNPRSDDDSAKIASSFPRLRSLQLPKAKLESTNFFLASSPHKPQQLYYLSKLSHLKALTLADGTYNNEDIVKHVTTDLESLVNIHIASALSFPFEQLTHLDCVVMRRFQTFDLAPLLAPLTRLVRLRVQLDTGFTFMQHTRVNCTGIEVLTSLTRLRHLDLCSLTSESLCIVTCLTALRSLRAPAGAWAPAVRFPHLHTLRASVCTPEPFADTNSLPSLRCLHLDIDIPHSKDTTPMQLHLSRFTALMELTLEQRSAHVLSLDELASLTLLQKLTLLGVRLPDSTAPSAQSTLSLPSLQVTKPLKREFKVACTC